MTVHVNALRAVMGPLEVGRLSATANGEIYFQYENTWLDAGFDLSPSTIPFNATPLPGARQPFNGLHGVFNDSLPDGWGLLLMDRALQSRYGWHREQINPLDRLAYIGNRGMGALEYLPELHSTTTEHAVDMAALAAAAEVVTSGGVGEVVAELYLQGGSPGGARPKVTVARDLRTGACLSGFMRIPDNYEHWIVKFHGRDESRDSGRIEMAYAEMAAAAGLHIPPTELLEVSLQRPNRRRVKQPFFAAQRFDRHGNDKDHVISLAGYLHADHRVPSLDYQHLLAATQRLTRDVGEVRQAFRLMVFNVLAHNKDDHAKNFAFVRSAGAWCLSPSFDLTYSSGLGNEHTSAVGGKGNPDRDDVLSVARSFGVRDATGVIDEVRHSVTRWPLIAAKWEIPATSAKSIAAGLLATDRHFWTS
jgi:serine/threonine-protein kinase HipA